MIADNKMSTAAETGASVGNLNQTSFDGCREQAGEPALLLLSPRAPEKDASRIQIHWL
jgi:hypothetical protein